MAGAHMETDRRFSPQGTQKKKKLKQKVEPVESKMIAGAENKAERQSSSCYHRLFSEFKYLESFIGVQFDKLRAEIAETGTMKKQCKRQRCP